MRTFFHSRLIAPVVALLTQGITPEKIALSLAFGIVLGVFPVLGSTTILCAAAAVIFRLNLPAIQLVNWLIYPLQLVFIVPLIRMGEMLLHATRLKLSLAQMLALIHADLPRAIATLWLAELHAMLAWMLIGPLAIFLIYFLLSRALRQIAGSFGVRGATAEVA